MILTKRLEAAIEDTKLLQAGLSDFKKKLTETEAKLSMKVSEGENVRYELNTCSKNLNEAQVIVAKLMFSFIMLSLTLWVPQVDCTGSKMFLKIWIKDRDEGVEGMKG